MSLMLFSPAAFAFSSDEFEVLPVQGTWANYTSPARLPLPELLDGYFNTGLAFDADGVRVQVSGGTAQKKPYVVLVPDGQQPVFVDGSAIILGSRVVTINGARYEFSVGVNLFHQRRSHVHVNKLVGEKRRLMLDPTIDEIVTRGNDAGAAVTLGGRLYRFCYGRKVARAQDGSFSIVPGTFASFVLKEGEKVTPNPLPEIEAIRSAPQRMTVGSVQVRLSMDGDTLVVEDGSTASRGQAALAYSGYLGAAN